MKIRTRSIIVLAATLLLTAIVVLPRVIEAGRSIGSSGDKKRSGAPLVTSYSARGRTM